MIVTDYANSNPEDINACASNTASQHTSQHILSGTTCDEEQPENRDPADGDSRETENVFSKEEPAIVSAEDSLQTLEAHRATNCSHGATNCSHGATNYSNGVIQVEPSTAGSTGQQQGHTDSVSATNDCICTPTMHSAMPLGTNLSQPSFGGPHSMLRHGYSLSQSPRIQRLQFELGFIDEITVKEETNLVVM